MAKRYYDLTVAGCERRLTILNLNENLAIAGFIMLGDVELCESCARELAKKIPADTEIIMTAETKGIPLAGGSMTALGRLAEKAGAKVIGQAAVLAEGDAAKRTDIIFLEPLPLFAAE